MPQVPAKVRVYELSKALDVSNKEVLTVLEQQFGVVLKSHSSTVEPDVATKVTAFLKKDNAQKNSEPRSGEAVVPKPTEAKAPASTPSSESAMPSTGVPSPQSNPLQPNRTSSGQAVPSVRPSAPSAPSAKGSVGEAKTQESKTVVRVGEPSGASAALPVAPARPLQRTVVSVGNTGSAPAPPSAAPAPRPAFTSGNQQGQAAPRLQRYRPGEHGPQQQGTGPNRPQLQGQSQRPAGNYQGGYAPRPAGNYQGGGYNQGNQGGYQQQRPPMGARRLDEFRQPGAADAGRPPQIGADGRPVERRPVERSGERPQGARPQGDRSSGERSGYGNQQRPPIGGRQGQGSAQGNAQGQRPDGQRPYDNRGGAPGQRGDRPSGAPGQQGMVHRTSGDGRPSQSSGLLPASADVFPVKTAVRGVDHRKDKDKGSKVDKIVAEDGNKSPRKPTVYRPTQAAGSMRSKRGKRDRNQERQERMEPEVLEKPSSVEIEKTVTVRDLAVIFRVPETEIIKQLFLKGVMVTINQILDFNAIKAVGEQLEIEVLLKEAEDKSLIEVASVLDAAPEAGAEEALVAEGMVARAPVISIMGHVDHGKTSLLDAIRSTRHKIVSGEAGGITQSIGAYSVEKEGRRIVFLDTPGHEAFTAMRMRGAKATDIAILVVAADDGVMPQTIEAINHAKAAGLPIIVAVNKIDKDNADPDKVLSELSEHGLVTEKWGGDTISVEVSALQQFGIDDLLEMVLLVTELKAPKANPTVPAEGVIIEARLDKGKGPVVSALVQNGTLRVGDNLFVGSVGGRVRALIDDQGNRLQQAGPSTPVEILGLSDVPFAGDTFRAIPDEKEFKAALSQGKTDERDKRMESRAVATGGLTRSLDDSNRKELRLVLKADSQGALEAAQAAFNNLNTDEVQVNVLHSATGDISETDVMLAAASEAVLFGFNVKEDKNAERIREKEGVTIYLDDVIYHMVERVEKLMLGRLDAEVHVIEMGKAEVRQLFSIGKSVIAGSMITDGKLVRGGLVEVVRGGKTVHTGKLDMLRRFKDDVKEVSQGFECGLSVNKFHTWEVGDVVVCRMEEKRERTSL